MASQDNPPFKTMLEITPIAAIHTAMNFNVEIRSLKMSRPAATITIGNNKEPKETLKELPLLGAHKKSHIWYPINAPQII